MEGSVFTSTAKTYFLNQGFEFNDEKTIARAETQSTPAYYGANQSFVFLL